MFTHSNDEIDKTLNEILIAKSLPLDLFEQDANLNLNSDLTDHVNWVFNHIYSVAYPGKQIEEAIKSGIPRYIHGIEHVSRVALYVKVFANLYRKHGDKAALQLSNEDIKLMQIAALFHDAARENEGDDLWDRESATLLYYYLTKILHVDKEKAKWISESTANKELSDGYFKIHEDQDGNIIWEQQYENIPPKNIFQKIIHDADCLDIIRARPGFNAEYLDFYSDIAKEGNNIALEEMAHLIMEARSLIEKQGDSFNHTKPDIKKRYENEAAYDRIMADINEKDYRIINALGKQLLDFEKLNLHPIVDLTPYAKEKGLTEQNMNAALREGLVFSRGIGSPSAWVKEEKKNRKETLAELDLRKTMREPGIVTSSTKEDRKNKSGNPVRSVSMLGYGSGVYSDAGFLIVDPDINAISQISAVDMDSDRGKKKHHQDLKNKNKVNLKSELRNLNEKLKIGGEVNERYGSTHAEILYDITKYDAIYYSNDPNSHNTWMANTNKTDLNIFNLQQTISFKPVEPFHRHSSKLQAVYLLKQYEKQYELTRNEFIKIFGEVEGEKKFIERFGARKSLPIFEYSGVHGTIKEIPESHYNEVELLNIWKEICDDYLENLAKVDISKLYYLSNQDIKILCMYYPTGVNSLFQHNGPADSNYPSYLQLKINDLIEQKKKSLIDKYEQEIVVQIYKSNRMIFDDTIYRVLMRSPSLLGKIWPMVAPVLSGLYSNIPRINSSQFSSGNTTYEEKIFNLSIKLNLNAISQGIKENAYHAAKNEIDQIKLNLSQSNKITINDLNKVINHIFNLKILINAFQIQYWLSPAIEEISRSVLKIMTDDFIKNRLNILDYSKLLQDLNAKKFLDSDLYIDKPRPDLFLDVAYCKAQADVREGLYSVGEVNALYKFKAYLELARLAKTDLRVIHEDAVAWFSHFPGQLTTPESVADIMDVLSSIQLNDSNLGLFNILIQKISLRRLEERDLFNLDLNNWVNGVVKLQEFMKDKKFTSEQLKIIQTKWMNEVSIKYIKFLNSDDFISGRDEFNSILLSLMKFSDLNIDLPLDPLLNALNNKLKEIIHSRNETEKLFESNVRSSYQEFPWGECEEWLKKNENTDIKALKDNLKQLMSNFESLKIKTHQEQLGLSETNPEVNHVVIEHNKSKGPK